MTRHLARRTTDDISATLRPRGGGSSPCFKGALFALLTALVAGPGAAAQPLADRLPASTLVYVGWSPNVALQTTAAAKMLADERVMGPWRQVLQDVLLEMRDDDGGAAGGGSISAQLPYLLRDAAQCEGAFALLELRQAKRRLNPQSVLMIDLGAKRKEFEEHFKPVHARMKERVGERLKMVKLGDSWVFAKPDREGRSQVTWGFVGDTFVMFLGDGADEFVPKLVKGTVGETLKAAPAFADTVGKVPGESAVLTTYLDTKGSLGVVQKLLEREGNADFQLLIGNWDKLLGELGLDNVRGMGEKTVVEDRQFVTRSLLRTDGPPRGLLAFAAQQAVDAAMIKAIPPDAMAAAAVRLDLAKAYDQVKASAIKLAGNGAREGFNQLEQGSEGLGLPLKDVLSALGDQWVVYNAASQGGFAFTGWTLVTNVRDAAKFDKAAGAVRGMLVKMLGDGGGGGRNNARVRQLNVDGVRIEYLEFGQWGTPFSPAWAVVGDRFVVALYPQLVEDAVRQLRDGGKSLLDNPDYVASRKRTGDAGPVLYTSGPEIAKSLYPVGLLLVSFAKSFGGFGDGDGDGDDEAATGADLLPSMRRLMEYVGHDALSVKATADGVLKTRTVANPLTSPIAWADSPVLWLALGVPTLGASEDAADRVASASNLRQIGAAVMFYSNENKGKFPPDIATLTKTQDLAADAIKSPFGPAKDGADFVLIQYPGGVNPAQGPHAAEVIIAYDKAALDAGDGTNALYADGHVEWHAPDAFKRLLEDSRRKALAKPQAQPKEQDPDQ
jgi:prepilin-type processing-associated H-X9-DG protein